MNYNYDPESHAVSPRLPAIVNAKHQDSIFVYVLHLNISAMIHRPIKQLNSSLSSVEVGDLLDVTIQATEMHKSRHEVIRLDRMDLPPSIKNVYTENINGDTVAIVQAIVQARKDGILVNEFIGRVDQRCIVPREVIRSGQSFVAELKVLPRKGEGGSFGCIKYLGKCNNGQLEVKKFPVKERRGVIWSFTGFHYLVWCPECGFEVVLLPKILNRYNGDFIGQWISFNTLREVRDSVNIEGKVELIDAVYPTQNKENVIEIYACCVLFGYSNQQAILIIQGTDQRISLKGIEDVNPNLFPRSMWLKPSSDRPFIWESSRNVDLERRDACSSSRKIENYDMHRGVILNIYNNIYLVWSNMFSENLICDAKYFKQSESVLGLWISFNNYSHEGGRPKIHHPRVIPDVYPTRYNEKLKCVEIEVTCDSEEKPGDDGFRVYTSDDIGLVVDSFCVLADSIALPFKVWVTEDKEHRNCCWRISSSNNDYVNCIRKPDVISNRRGELTSPQPRNIPISPPVNLGRSRSVTPPPEMDTSENRPNCNLPGVPRIIRDEDIKAFMENLSAEQGGVYTDDEEDVNVPGNNIREDEEKELSSTSTNLSDDEYNAEMQHLSFGREEVQSSTSNVQESKDFSEMNLKQMCCLILENEKFCKMLEEEDSRFYHAFANKVNE